MAVCLCTLRACVCMFMSIISFMCDKDGSYDHNKQLNMYYTCTYAHRQRLIQQVDVISCICWRQRHGETEVAVATLVRLSI